MKKNNIFILIIGIINLVLCFCLTYFCVPAQIPVFVNLTERITIICSKWLLVINMVLPLLISIIILILKNKTNYHFALKSLFVFFIYENMLAFSYFSITDVFVCGELSEIPLAISFFIPLACAIVLYAIKMKHLPYKSKLGLRTKQSTKTEFIWKQTHFLASEIYFGTGIFLFLISIIFIFVRIPWIEAIIAFVMLLLSTLLALNQAKVMYNKYTKMEKNKERLDKEKNKG